MEAFIFKRKGNNKISTHYLQCGSFVQVTLISNEFQVDVSKDLDFTPLYL